MSKPTFRMAEEKDCGLILFFIRQLAEYEKMLDEVVADEQLLHQQLFVDKRAEVMFICEDDREVGFALFFHNFSTFLGRTGLYLEDIYILPQYRHKGYCTAAFRQLAKIARERGCGRIDWWCLDWNQKSIEFYEHLGARAMDQWTVFRLDEESMARLATQEDQI